MNKPADTEDNLKKEIKEFYKTGMWMLIGSIVSMLILEIRFRNPLLRRELILLMQDGTNGYFMMFVILDVFLLLAFGGFYLYALHKKKQRGKQK